MRLIARRALSRLAARPERASAAARALAALPRLAAPEARGADPDLASPLARFPRSRDPAPSSRGFAAASAGSPLTPEEVERRMDEINDSFAEAREEIEAAMEAVGTTYFNEEAEYAREVTERTLEMYRRLCSEMGEEERAKTQRAMGMKMEQLKAEREQIDHAHDDH